MKEAYFKRMEWTKIFVSGPVDPRWNPYKIYCQICKGNISIYGRRAKEILRHRATERHLRKEQRWRYEHLSREDPNHENDQTSCQRKKWKAADPLRTPIGIAEIN